MPYQIVVPALFEPDRAVSVEETGNKSHHEITLIDGHGSNRRSERLVFLVHRITDLSAPTRPFSLIRVSAWDRSLLGCQRVRTCLCEVKLSSGQAKAGFTAGRARSRSKSWCMIVTTEELLPSPHLPNSIKRGPRHGETQPRYTTQSATARLPIPRAKSCPGHEGSAGRQTTPKSSRAPRSVTTINCGSLRWAYSCFRIAKSIECLVQLPAPIEGHVKQ